MQESLNSKSVPP